MTDSFSEALCLPRAMANCLQPRIRVVDDVDGYLRPPVLLCRYCSVVIASCTKGPCRGRWLLSRVSQS